MQLLGGFCLDADTNRINKREISTPFYTERARENGRFFRTAHPTSQAQMGRLSMESSVVNTTHWVAKRASLP